jgi:hypothetical protein
MFLQHFWIICGLWVGLGGAHMYRLPRRRDARIDGESKILLDRFARGWAIAILIPTTSLWLLQMSIGSDAPLDYTQWPDPQLTIALAIQIVCWCVIIYWIWFGNGANILAEVSRIRGATYSKYLSSPNAFRTLSIVLTLSSACGLYLGFQQH